MELPTHAILARLDPVAPLIDGTVEPVMTWTVEWVEWASFLSTASLSALGSEFLSVFTTERQVHRRSPWLK